MTYNTVQADTVAPFTGAWIEIRGVKKMYICKTVAPFTGAWIEMFWAVRYISIVMGRSLHGSVD